MTELERLQMNTNQAEADLMSVKNALQDAGVEIAAGTPSSEYGGLVGEVYEAGHNDAKQQAPHDTTIGNPVQMRCITEFGLTELKLCGNSVQDGVPTADSPVEIKSVGDLVTESVNLLDKDSVSYIIGFFNKTNQTIQSHANARTVYVPCKPNTTYTVSRDTNYQQFHIGCTANPPQVGISVVYGGYDTSGEAASLSMTTSNDARYLVVYLYNGYNVEGQDGGWESIIKGLRIEENGIIGKYQIPIEIHSKNIFDVDNYVELCNANMINSAHKDQMITKEVVEGKECIKIDGVAGRYLDTLPCSFKENTQYTITFDYYDELHNNNRGIIMYAKYEGEDTIDDKNPVFLTNSVNTWGKRVWTSQPNKTLLYMSMAYGTGQASTYISNWQIEEGVAFTDYDLYVEPLEYQIYLDEPLRKVEDTFDYIDLISGQVVRNVGVVDNTNTQSIDKSFIPLTNPTTSHISIPIIKLPEDVTTTVMESNTKIKGNIKSGYYSKQSYQDGVKSEYDRFWDNGLDYGKPSSYQNLFAGFMWNNATFKPKYDIILPPKSSAYMMFRGCGVKGDLVEILKNCNVKLDFSKCDNMQYTFNNTQFTRIGVIDLSSCRYLQSTFQANTTLEIIDEIILKSDGSQDLSSVFGMCNVLKDIKFSGVIGSNINFKDSPLNKASLESTVQHLLPTATGKNATFKKSAVDAAFETSEGANDGSSTLEWERLITPYANFFDGNWTISLV